MRKSSILSFLSLLLLSLLAVGAIRAGHVTAAEAGEASQPYDAGPLWSSTLPPLNWTSACLECSKRFGDMTDRSLRLDADGHPHIAYGGDRLYYARHDGSAWHLEQVTHAPSAGAYASLALDSAGNPHIAFHESSKGDLKYARASTDGWVIRTVDQSAKGMHTSIAVDEAGIPHISYRAGNVLKYAHWTGAGWSIQKLDIVGQDGGYSSLALDDAGYPHIAYYVSWPNYDLKYARWTGNAWDVQAVDSVRQAGRYNSLVLDQDGNPHISYCKLPHGAQLSGCSGLMYASLTGNGWQVQAVELADGVGGYNSLAVGSAGDAHISYVDSDKGILRYARWDGDFWEIQTVDAESKAGLFTSIALDSTGMPHISYGGDTGRSIKFAAWSGASWDIEAVDDANAVGVYSSLALDAAGSPHASFLDAGQVRYARRKGSFWQVSTVEAEVGGDYASLALDSEGNPHISYSRNGSLRYARWMDGGWAIDTVNRVGDVGRYSALALSSADEPRIAYYGDGGLSFALWDGSDWIIQRVDSMTRQAYVSLVIDGAGDPHISYVSGYPDYSLKYAYWNGDAWHSQIVDSARSTLGQLSLALDSDANPHISYRGSYPAHDLRYAYREGMDWNISIVDNEDAGDSNLSLALDSAGRPNISYYALGKLKHARWNGQDWEVQTVASDLGYLSGHASLALDSADRPHVSYYDSTSGSLMYAVGEARPPFRVYVPGIGASTDRYSCRAEYQCDGNYGCVDVASCDGYALATACQIDAADWWEDILADYPADKPVRFMIPAGDQFCFQSTLVIQKLSNKVFSGGSVTGPARFLAGRNLNNMIEVDQSHDVRFRYIEFVTDPRWTVYRFVKASDSRINLADSGFEDCNLECLLVVDGSSVVRRTAFRRYYSGLTLENVAGGFTDSNLFDNSDYWGGYENAHIVGYNLQLHAITNNTIRSRNLSTGTGAQGISIIGNARHTTLSGNTMYDLNDVGIWVSNRMPPNNSGCFAQDAFDNPLPPQNITITGNTIGTVFGTHYGIELCGHAYVEWCGQSTNIDVTGNSTTGNLGQRVTQSDNFYFDEASVVCSPPCSWQRY